MISLIFLFLFSHLAYANTPSSISGEHLLWALILYAGLAVLAVIILIIVGLSMYRSRPVRIYITGMLVCSGWIWLLWGHIEKSANRVPRIANFHPSPSDYERKISGKVKQLICGSEEYERKYYYCRVYYSFDERSHTPPETLYIDV